MINIEKLELKGDAVTAIYLKNYYMEQAIVLSSFVPEGRNGNFKFRLQERKILIQYKEGVPSNVSKHKMFVPLLGELQKRFLRQSCWEFEPHHP